MKAVIRNQLSFIPIKTNGTESYQGFVPFSPVNNRASDYPVHRVNQASDYPVHTPVRIDERPSEFLIRKLLQFNRSKQIEMSDTDV